MKAERRHDLKTNTLATTITELPDFWKAHGTKILLALVVIVAIALLVQHRINSKAEAQRQSLESLAAAQERIAMLKHPMYLMREPAAAMADLRVTSSEAEKNIEETLALATDPKVRAEALVAKGDLNLILAQVPAMPGATTQPSLQKPLADDVYLKRAEDAYRQVLGSNQMLEFRSAAITAHFGMAAVQEDRGNWKEAAEHYQTVQADGTAPQILRMIAQRRLTDELPLMQTAPLIGGAATQPAAVAPTTAPTTLPAM